MMPSVIAVAIGTSQPGHVRLLSPTSPDHRSQTPSSRASPRRRPCFASFSTLGHHCRHANILVSTRTYVCVPGNCNLSNSTLQPERVPDPAPQVPVQANSAQPCERYQRATHSVRHGGLRCSAWRQLAINQLRQKNRPVSRRTRDGISWSSGRSPSRLTMYKSGRYRNSLVTPLHIFAWPRDSLHVVIHCLLAMRLKQPSVNAHKSRSMKLFEIVRILNNSHAMSWYSLRARVCDYGSQTLYFQSTFTNISLECVLSCFCLCIARNTCSRPWAPGQGFASRGRELGNLAPSLSMVILVLGG